MTKTYYPTVTTMYWCSGVSIFCE